MGPVLVDSRCSGVVVHVLLVLSVAWSVVARTDDTQRSTEWPRVVLTDPVTLEAVRNTLERATKWLGDSRCQALFTDFRDAHNLPLDRRLTDLGVSAKRYLKFVVFRDATESDYCEQYRPLAFTQRGSRVVFVCGRDFVKAWKQAPRRATAVVIHEMLHTLGLGENPPADWEITQQVLRRCAR
jgi:hypothetical protein